MSTDCRPVSVVTGSFGYIGRHITYRLLQLGCKVKTITAHPDKPNPFGNAVRAYPFNFEKPEELTATLESAKVLYNTYWIRYEYGGATYRQAVQNTVRLFECAKKASVSRIVHISVTHASTDSKLPYYAGKGQQEQALAESGVPYRIIRPALVFGKEDILVNNIAWLIRRFPVFPIFGSGTYRVQPIFVGDLAAIAVSSASSPQSATIDAVGPETFTFEGFVRLIAEQVKPSVRLIHLSPAVGIVFGKLIGLAIRDVILTRNELKGLMDNLLVSDRAPNGETRFSEWLAASKHTIGSVYSSELKRHFRLYMR